LLEKSYIVVNIDIMDDAVLCKVNVYDRAINVMLCVCGLGEEQARHAQSAERVDR